jgi:NADH-quinone oxidoreductase subunit G
VQDLFASKLSAMATMVFPATSAFEKDATFVNHAGLAQTFSKAVKPHLEIRGELQVAYDLLGKKGLATASAVRKDMAKDLPCFASLAVEKPAAAGKRLELATV